MALRIGVLRDSTFNLCSSISGNLKAFDVEHRSLLKALMVELRLLGGSLFSLERLILDLYSDNEDIAVWSQSANDSAWPVVDGCELLLQGLQDLYTVAEPEGLKDAKSAVLAYRSKFSLVVGSSESLLDVAMHFCVLGREPIPRLQRRGQGFEQSLSASDTTKAEPTPEDLLCWMKALNSEDHDREPAEYSKEMTIVQSRRLASPLYQTAATRWPSYAEAHWALLRPHVCLLFQSRNSFNFAQWVLEYAREVFPRRFGSLAISHKLLLELTDALCNGSIAPLHLAAALGLPSLCRDLLSMDADVNQLGLLGSPLFCALVGPNVLVTREEPESWTSLLISNYANADRAGTILLLLEKGADCLYQYRWKNADEASLAGLALWMALSTKHEAVFTQIVANGADLDGALTRLIQREKFIHRGLVSVVRLYRLLFFIYDATLSALEDVGPNAEALRGVVRVLMKESRHVYVFPEDHRRVSSIEDLRFRYLVRESIVNSDSFMFHRLLVDPRFDPDLPFDERQVGGTILHMAIEGSHVEIIDSLIKAGASLKATDAEGRTPMMVVEDPQVLAKLVLEYGASTTAVDNKGRTIWHLAASTNDVLLKWLRDNDPCKQQNLVTKNLAGCTPLADAFLYIDSLKERAKGWQQILPTAARILLEEPHTAESMQSPHSLLHCAIEWGEVDLVDKLLEIGYEVEGDHGPLLRRLNFAASDEMVERVLELFAGESFVFADGSTVAETILTNTALTPRLNSATFARPTAHPSCYPKLSRDAFETFLTPEVRKAKDSQGRGIWARFCDNIIPMLSGPSCTPPQRLSFFVTFLSETMSSLNAIGALEEHELTTGQWAILYMADQKGAIPSWERWHFPYIAHALGSSVRNESRCITSVDGAFLLAQAVRRNQEYLVALLIDRGVQVHTQRAQLSGKCLLEHLISDAVVHATMLETLLNDLEPRCLVPRQRQILLSLLDLPRDFHAGGLLKSLLSKQLINPNEISTDEPGSPSMLQETIEQGKPELAWILLDHGADPAFSKNGDWAVLCAAKKGYTSIFIKILEEVGSDFDWHCVYNVPSKRTYNALQVAAAHGRDVALAWLLDQTTLRLDLDRGTLRNKLAPIHLAVEAGSLTCVTVLKEKGADLEIRDPTGFTPLLLAIRGDHEDIIRYLLEAGVNTETDRYGMHISSTWRRSSVGIVKEFVTSKLEANPVTPGEKPSPAKLGALLADMIENCDPQTEGAIATILTEIPKEELMAAILPCGGCTLLSYAGAHHASMMMLELVDLGFGGFVTGCSTHWVHGYNALHHACFGLLRQVDIEQTEVVENTLKFIRKDHADEYWKLVEEVGLFSPQDSVDGENTVTRLLRFVVNLRCGSEDWVDYGGGALPNALHLLVDSIGREAGEGCERSMFQILISCGIDVNAQDGDCTTALHFVAARGVMPVLELLIKAGADPNIRDDTGATPLARAVDWGDINVVRYLVERGAKTETYTGVAHFFMHSKPSMKYMRELASLGFDLHAAVPGSSSLTSMMMASTPTSRGFILNHDIDFDAVVAEIPQLLNLLLSHDCGAAAIRKVMRRAPREYHDEILHPVPAPRVHPVCTSIRRGDAAVINTLIGFGWDFEKSCSVEGSALMFACSMGVLASVQLFVRRGARLSYVAADSHGRRVVKSAVEEAKVYPEIVQWLLVGRFQDLGRLEWANDVSSEVPVKPWSGPRKGAHRLSGFDGHYIRPSSQSIHEQLERLRRIKTIRRELAGKIVQVTLVE
ncbi:hypothetical protein AK830_g12356 [Neonectria ditissima]|uniref:Uncharacterized protein n=1 Tax=Neonectria ditissima TaxID=78410 RepID=A0A0P7APP0_9HYPO|nr:hypothetical protein AK830_g12356 [Neonectria ditissima]